MGEIVKPLSVNEQSKLSQLENIIFENFGAFVKVGQALAEIRDRRLYREQFKTFELYAKRIFDVARSRAYQLIEASEVVGDLSTMVDKKYLPRNERQARELARLPKEQQPKVWQEVVDFAGDRKITATLVKKKVNAFIGEEVKQKIKTTREKANKDEELPEPFKAAFDSFLAQIQFARQTNYKTTPRKTILKYINSVLAIVIEDDK